MKYTHLILSGAWYLLVLAWGNLTTVQGQNVGSQEALDIAAHYLSQQHGDRAPERGGTQLSIAYTAQEGAETYYHVVSNGEDGGYVIVGGHDAANEILGYVEEGHFDYDSIAPAMRWLLGTYEEQIHAVYNDEALARRARAGKRDAVATRTNVPNFVSTKWSQWAPYNLGITNSKNEYPIGCLPTAQAQILKYYNYPAQATNPAMEGEVLEDVTSQPVEENRVFNYSAMQNSYSSYYATSYSGSNKAVADLLYLVARVNGTHFRKRGSGTSAPAARYSFIQNFNYDRTLEYVERKYFDDEEWDDMMYAEMLAKRPVMYSGSSKSPDKSGAHSFLLTGYSDAKYYVNWGWDTNGGNGLFALDALNNQGYGFNYNQDAITHIKKNEGGQPSYQIKSYSLINTVIGLGQVMQTKVSILANCICGADYLWQIKLRNKTTGVVTPLHEGKRGTLTSEGKLDTFKINDTIPTTLTPSEEYDVLLFYCNCLTDNTWMEFQQTPIPTITIKDCYEFKNYPVGDVVEKLGGSYSVPVYIRALNDMKKPQYRMGLKVRNLTTIRPDSIVDVCDIKTSSTSFDHEVIPFFIPGYYNVGDQIEFTLLYRIATSTEWKEMPIDPITIALDAPTFGLALRCPIYVANEGYITPENFEVRLVLKYYKARKEDLKIEMELYQNGKYQGSIGTGKITFEANETKEVVLTPENCPTNCLKSIATGLDYQFAVYNGSYNSQLEVLANTPILHLIPYGDVTLDGNNDSDDIKAIALYLLDHLGHPLSIASKVAADGNVDGKVSLSDLPLLIKSQQ